MEKVDITVGNYEWVCPSCEELNQEIELARDYILQCRECLEFFEVGNVTHAYA